MMRVFIAMLRRDVRLLLLRGAEGFMALFFFFIVVTLFSFAFGGDAALLQKAAPGIIWVTALLAALLALESLYHRDFDDGTFDVMLMSPVPALVIIFSKMATHWIVTGMGLVVGLLLALPMMGVPPGDTCVFAFALALGTVYISFIGGFGAVLTCGARRPGLLLMVMIAPLLVPMLVFGLSAMEAALAGMPAKPYLLLQLALVVAALPLSALAASRVLLMQVHSS